MDWLGFLSEAFWGSFDTLRQLALIIFPLLIVVEVVDELGILDKISRLFAPIVKYFNLPKEAGLPLIIAQIFGLLYGAGLIIRFTDDDVLTNNQTMTLAIFLVVCHSAIEDTLLFVAIGGNGFVVLMVRVVLAILLTYLYGNYVGQNEQIKLNQLNETNCCK